MQHIYAISIKFPRIKLYTFSIIVNLYIIYKYFMNDYQPCQYMYLFNSIAGIHCITDNIMENDKNAMEKQEIWNKMRCPKGLITSVQGIIKMLCRRADDWQNPSLGKHTRRHLWPGIRTAIALFLQFQSLELEKPHLQSNPIIQ